MANLVVSPLELDGLVGSSLSDVRSIHVSLSFDLSVLLRVVLERGQIFGSDERQCLNDFLSRVTDDGVPVLINLLDLVEWD